jgi:hypothetical protein
MIGGLLLKDLTPDEQEEKLNMCGRDGWELVNIREEKINGGMYLMFYFKRPLSDSEDAESFNPRQYDFAA